MTLCILRDQKTIIPRGDFGTNWADWVFSGYPREEEFDT